MDKSYNVFFILWNQFVIMDKSYNAFFILWNQVQNEEDICMIIVLSDCGGDFKNKHHENCEEMTFYVILDFLEHLYKIVL